MIYLKQGAKRSVKVAIINTDKPITERSNLLKLEDEAVSNFISSLLQTALVFEVSFRGGGGAGGVGDKKKTPKQKTKPPKPPKHVTPRQVFEKPKCSFLFQRLYLILELPLSKFGQ